MNRATIKYQDQSFQRIHLELVWKKKKKKGLWEIQFKFKKNPRKLKFNKNRKKLS